MFSIGTISVKANHVTCSGNITLFLYVIYITISINVVFSGAWNQVMVYVIDSLSDDNHLQSVIA